MNHEEAIKKLGRIPKTSFHISEIRQVLIKKCSGKDYWYRDEINEVFVVEHKPIEHNGITNFKVIRGVEKFDRNMNTKAHRTVNLIEKNDCLIIPNE